MIGVAQDTGKHALNSKCFFTREPLTSLNKYGQHYTYDLTITGLSELLTDTTSLLYKYLQFIKIGNFRATT